jgi:hypothetical protein
LRGRAAPLRTTSAVALVVPLLDVRRDVRIDLRQQRRRKHSPGAFTDQLVDVQLEAGPVLVFNHYPQHGRALLGRPSSRPGL